MTALPASRPFSESGLRLVNLFVVACTVAACDSPVSSTPPDISSASVNRPAAPLARVLDVRLERSSGAQVEYWSDEGPRLRVTSEDVAVRHDLVLTRLRPDATYQFEVSSSGAQGDGIPVQGSFTTDPLPAGLGILEFTAEGTSTEPLTLLEIIRHEGGFTGVVIVDGDGSVVWFFEAVPVQGARVRGNGNFVFLDGTRGIIEVAPTGEVVAELPQEPHPGRRAHHDVITTPANTLLFIASDTREYEGRSILGEAIWEWDPESDALNRRWSSWDHLSPDVDWGPGSKDDDWLHANSLALGPTGNALISLRFTDQVISISPDFSEIEWRLGGINADVQVSGSDVFIGQHTAAELPPVDGRRRVLLFDNGPIGRGFSRAQELELDLDALTATTEWEFRPTPDNFSFITSLARRLPNGNTFVAFGAGPDVLSSFGPVEVFEVDPSGEVQFRLEIGGPTVDESFILYRGSPLSGIASEEIVDTGDQQ